MRSAIETTEALRKDISKAKKQVHEFTSNDNIIILPAGKDRATIVLVLFHPRAFPTQNMDIFVAVPVIFIHFFWHSSLPSFKILPMVLFFSVLLFHCINLLFADDLA